MARSSKVDPVEKFRFRVTVLALDLSLTSAADSLAALSKGSFGVLSRSGFNSVTLPKVNVSEIPYRENIDNLRFQKIPGLVKYDNITMTRGVTNNTDFYEWFRLVNEELAFLATAQEVTSDTKYIPRQSESFRKDVFIEVLDREGKTVKGWFLMNAWPVSYKPGNDLNATSDEKLVEELTLAYELFLEVNQENGLAAIGVEIAKSAALPVAAAILDTALDFFKGKQ